MFQTEARRNESDLFVEGHHDAPERLRYESIRDRLSSFARQLFAHLVEDDCRDQKKILPMKVGLEIACFCSVAEVLYPAG